MIVMYHLVLIALYALIDSEKLELNKEVEEKMGVDSNYHFYTLTLPNKTDTNVSNANVLIIQVEDNGFTMTDYSNPFLYVSLEKPEPKSRNESTWYSESYGSNIISIGAIHVLMNTYYYIGVHCLNACSYKLKAELKEETELIEGKVHTNYFKKNSSVYFIYNHNTTIDAKEDSINFAFISTEMNPFKVFITNSGSPCKQNTFIVKPSWINGYSLNIPGGSPLYCNECSYKMLLESLDKDVNVKILITTHRGEINLKYSEQFIDSLNEKMSQCYTYPIALITSSSSPVMQDSIIITAMLFSGSIIVQLNGYDSIVNMDYLDLPYDNNTISIKSEKVIIITPEDLKKYKEKAKNPNASHFHFCIYAIEAASYNLDVHLASQTEALQRFNAIMVGQSIMGYLPKGQVNAYSVIEMLMNNEDENYVKNITIDLDMIEGESDLYAYYSMESHPKIINSEFIDKQLKEKGDFLISKYTFSGAEIVIDNKDNTCHKKHRINEKAICALYAIIHCKDLHSDCLYKLNVKNDNTNHHLTPSTPLTNSLSKDQTHYYTITIEDDNINTLTIILNKLSGDSSLYLYQYNNGISEKDMLSYSLNSIFDPNIIHLNKTKSKHNTLKGQYLIKVNATSYASYSIYYYTNYLPGDKSRLSVSDVSLALHTGQILEDYIIDSDDVVPFRLYSYTRTVKDRGDSDIRITVSKQGHKTVFFVYKDLNSFSYKNGDNDPIKGYVWKGIANELIIKASDPLYTSKGTYYIVVYLIKFNIEGMIKDENVMHTFYLGITDDSTDLILNEGLQHSSTLNNDSSYQGFSYLHSDIKNPFSLGLNVFYGTLELIIDFNPINHTELTREFYYRKTGYESQFITIPSDVLMTKCSSNTTCEIYFFVHRTTKSYCQYLLMPKSRSTHSISLNSDQPIEGTIQPKEIHYYQIRQENTDKRGILMVKFIDGNGNVFLSKSLSNSTYNIPLEHYPTRDKHDLVAEDSVEGKILHLPQPSKEKSYQIYLITIIGQFLGYDTSIQYVISFTNQAKIIRLNHPLQSSISAGQFHYYTLNVENDDNDSEAAKSLHVSLSSTNGDIALYMNYGSIFPSFTVYQWYSNNPIHAFINIDTSDPFFIGNSYTNLKGSYTIMIYAYQNTTYTIHTTTHNKRIMRIGNNIPGNCLCKSNYDTCHFTLDFHRYIDSIHSDLAIVFMTKFLYGSGDIYVKISNQSIINDLTALPRKEDYEYSNVVKNKRNFLKINLTKAYQDTNPSATPAPSNALITLQCLEKSFLTINTAVITNSIYQYIDSRRENLYYFRKNDTPTYLVAFFGEKSDINYEIVSYTGSAEVQVYQNISRFNGHEKDYEFIHIAQFTLNNKTSPYRNTITSTESNYNTYVTFKVVPLTNIGMYIKINYERDWTPIEVGRNIKHQVSKMKFFAYFVMLEEYKDIVLNVKCEDKDKTAKVGVKIVMYQTNPKDGDVPEANPAQLSPYLDQSTYDYEAETNQLLNFVSIKINEIPKESRKNQSIRVYIIITITSKDKSITPTTLDLLVSPRVNSFKRIDTSPYSYYFSNENIANNEQTIYDLKIGNLNHNMLVIELSSCKGHFDYRLRSKLTYFNEVSDSVITTSKESAGHTTIVAHGLTESNYYLSVWGKSSDNDSNVEYMMYYYSLNKNNHKATSISPILQYNRISRGNSINVLLPEINQKDNTGQKHEKAKMKFNVFITSNEGDFDRMESMCFLSKMKALPQGITYSYDEANHIIKVAGLSYGIKYLMNIMMENTETNEIFPFQPMPIIIEKQKGISSMIWIILIILIIAFMGYGAYYYSRKYKTTKQLLEEDASAIIPKSVNELRHMNDDYTDKMKYSQLDIEGI